jgi:type III secretory pathway component EscR
VTTEPWDGTPKSETKQGQEPAYMPSYGMSAADQQFTIGLGIYTNGFSLDGYVGERMLVYGPYIISGSTMELFGALAMSFKF